MEHWRTLLQTCAPWRYRNTSVDLQLKWITKPTSLQTCAHLWGCRNISIDIQLKWNIREHHSGPVHIFSKAGVQLLISHWSGTLGEHGEHTPDLCISLETWEQYPIEMEHWRISLWACTLWWHWNTLIDIQLKWNIERHHSRPVHTFRESGTHLLIYYWSGAMEKMENATPDLCAPLEKQEHIGWYPI